MNERDTRPDASGAAPLDDDAIARLIAAAGPRPSIPGEDLDAIAAAARVAWQARPGAEPAPAPPTASRRRSRPAAERRNWAAVAFAVAAALAALVFGARLWWEDVEAPAAAAPLATVVAATGSLRLEIDGAQRSLAVGDLVAAGAVVRTAAASAGAPAAEAQRGALRLESGAVIRIDTGTALRLASASRIDLLEGAIYADTDSGDATRATADPIHGRALEIHTRAGIARDVGTRFIAKLVAGSGDPELQVLVRDGAVAVERGDESAVARAGQRIGVRADAIERGSTAAYGPEWEWLMDAAPRFDVEGKSIAEILEWVSRETGWTVRYEGPGLAEEARRILQQGAGPGANALRPDQAAFVLLPGAKLDPVLQDGTLIVRRMH